MIMSSERLRELRSFVEADKRFEGGLYTPRIVEELVSAMEAERARAEELEARLASNGEVGA